MREEGCERVGGGVIFGGALDILETRIWYGDRETARRNLTHVDCVCLRRTSRPSFIVCRLKVERSILEVAIRSTPHSRGRCWEPKRRCRCSRGITCLEK